MARQENIEIFQDTENHIKQNSRLKEAVINSTANQLLIPEYMAVSELFSAGNKERYEQNADIIISKKRSYEAAVSYIGMKTCVHNFASATNPGGGVVKGSSAQEECLCRTSTLYPLLYRNTLRYSYYKHNSDHRLISKSSKGTDSLIYTEGVVICKTDEEFPTRLPKNLWVTVDVITIAAPDLRSKANPYAPVIGNCTYMNDAELFGYHVKRAIHMLTVAASKGADILVLGAFGCGAFENNPVVVSKAYKVAIDMFPKVFKHIEFAVYCPPTGSLNYDVFKACFDN